MWVCGPHVPGFDAACGTRPLAAVGTCLCGGLCMLTLGVGAPPGGTCEAGSSRCSEGLHAASPCVLCPPRPGRCPQGKAMDFVDVDENNTRWVQDFRLRSYASPAKLESIDGARYHALLIPSCPGALADLASSGSLARILQHFCSESKPICAVGHGVAALCCATSEDGAWLFQGYSVTGPSVYELVRAPGFAHLPLIVEDFVKDAGASFSASEPDAVHVVLDRHLVTAQNASSTVPAVQNLLFLCGSR
ncbi:glutamine amidotransferase-like class 1 domain-containing protein 1 isoform 1-T1 [Trichechus inunguis]